MNKVKEGKIKVIQAAESDEIAEIRRLFRAYADWLNVDLCFQGFEEELAGLKMHLKWRLRT